tara:strand:- start:147 stop:383 length:237 start_codon:yes stop_codon:yes gene_type:complete
LSDLPGWNSFIQNEILCWSKFPIPLMLSDGLGNLKTSGGVKNIVINSEVGNWVIFIETIWMFESWSPGSVMKTGFSGS